MDEGSKINRSKIKNIFQKHFCENLVIFFAGIRKIDYFCNRFTTQYNSINYLTIKTMLSKNIRALRESLGYTQANIATYLGITPSAVNQYENDSRPIPAEAVSQLALLFNVEEYELYQESPQQQQLLSAFAFRANEFADTDLKVISAFKKIVLNYFYIRKAIADEKTTARA
jgi:transcriptional regulator with XRE-family HTH domain